MAVGPESSALPQPLEGFLASQRSLDALLSTGHYRGSGAVARQLRAAAAAWVAGGQQGPAPLGAFAAALFAKVKSFPEAAAALAAADGGASLDRLVQQLEPVLQALKQLSHPAGRQSISTQLMLACLAKLEPADCAPDFCIDGYGLAVSSFAPRSSPFAWHVDHRLPVACGGATDAANLEAVQHRLNHCKRERIIDPELHRWQLRRQMERHTYVTAAQLRQLAAELQAQGKEPSYRNIEALLRCTLPWSAHNTSSSSSGRGGAERAARSEAGRLAEGRRRREEWSTDDEEALAVVAAKHELQAIRRGGSLRMSWEAVAADLGAGRSGEQCRNKWRRMRLRPEPDSEAAERPEEAGVEGEAEPGRRRQPRQGYRSWSEEEADTAAQLLVAVGARLAADSSFELTARSLPAKLEAACQGLWHVRLAQRLPGRTADQVGDKCCAMVEFAIQLVHKKQLLCKQRHADRGLTPHRWQHLAPHLLLLAKQLPLRGAVQQLVASEGDREEVRRFVEDPPLAGEPRLPRLQDYWPPPAPEPAEEAAPGSAAGMGAADSAAGAAAGVAAGAAAAPPQPPAAVGRQAAGKAAGGSQGSAGAPAAKVAAATHAAGSLGEAVIDLTLSDSEDEGTQVGGAVIDLTLSDSEDEGTQAAAAARQPRSETRPQSAAAPAAASQRSGQSGSTTGSRGSKSSRAAAERAALANANQQQAAASASARRLYNRTAEEHRQGIQTLVLRYGSQWKLIRNEVERDPALCGFLDSCHGDKTKGQKKIRDLARKWVQPAEQQARQHGGGRPAAA